MGILTPPPYSALAAPVLWAPSPSTGERFVAVVLIRYASPSEGLTSSHIAFRPKQLRAMIGGRRAASALGILEHVADFAQNALVQGISFEELPLPFDGFEVGKPIRIRGYSETQIVDSAIRSLSAFGTRETYVEEHEAERRNSVPTRQFLRSLKTAFSANDDTRKERFNKVWHLAGTPEMIIDYAHERHLVQVTSLPQSEPHSASLLKEAESKILELDITSGILRKQKAPTNPALLVNIEPLSRAYDAEAKRIAHELFERLKFMSEQKGLELLQASSPAEGAKILAGLDIPPSLAASHRRSGRLQVI